MAIRNSAKALIVHNGKILVNQCILKSGAVYYDLPGGGQHIFETMEEAVKREVLEETGYQIEVLRFAGIAEEISDNPKIRGEYAEYAHRIIHFFLVKLINEQAQNPTETDAYQTDSIWVTLKEADELIFCTECLTGKIGDLVSQHAPLYLGSVHTP